MCFLLFQYNKFVFIAAHILNCEIIKSLSWLIAYTLYSYLSTEFLTIGGCRRENPVGRNPICFYLQPDDTSYYDILIYV